MNSSEKKHTKFLTREIVGVTLALFSVLMLFMLVTGEYVFGSIGSSVQHFAFGVVGLLAYPLFAYTLYLGIAITAEKRWGISLKFTFAALGVLFFISCLIHTVTSRTFSLESYGSYLSACFASGEAGLGGCAFGGVVLGLLAYPLLKFTTAVGGSIIFALLAAACVGIIVLMFRAPLPAQSKPEKREPKAPEERARAPRNAKMQAPAPAAVPQPEGVKPYPRELPFDQMAETLSNAYPPAQGYLRPEADQAFAQPQGETDARRGETVSAQRGTEGKAQRGLYAEEPVQKAPAQAFARQEERGWPQRSESNAARSGSNGFVPPAYLQQDRPIFHHVPGSDRHTQTTIQGALSRDEAKRILSRDWDGKLPQTSESESPEPYYYRPAQTAEQRSQIRNFLTNDAGPKESLDDIRKTLFQKSSPQTVQAASTYKSKLTADPAELISHSKDVLYPQEQDKSAFYKHNLIFDSNSHFNNRTKATAAAVRGGYKPVRSFPDSGSFSENYESEVNRGGANRPVKILADRKEDDQPYTLRQEPSVSNNRESYLFGRTDRSYADRTDFGQSSYANDSFSSETVNSDPMRGMEDVAADSRTDYSFSSPAKTYTVDGGEEKKPERTGFATSFSANEALTRPLQRSVPKSEGFVPEHTPLRDPARGTSAFRRESGFRGLESARPIRTELSGGRDGASLSSASRGTFGETQSDSGSNGTEGTLSSSAEEDSHSGERDLSFSSIFSSGQNDTGRVSLDQSRVSLDENRSGADRTFSRGEEGRSYGRLGRDFGSDPAQQGALSRGEEEALPPTRVPEFSADVPQTTEERVGRGVFMTNLDLDQPKPKPRPKKNLRRYVKPPFDCFLRYDDELSANPEEIRMNKEIIVGTLADFRIDSEVMRVTSGPTVTRYDIDVPKGVQARKVAAYDEEIARQLRVTGGVSIYPNYESGFISIEVPNKKRATVGLVSILQDKEFMNAKPTSLTFAIGKDVEGRSICGSISKMTHILVAGSTGAGKSVFLNSLIVSLIMKYSPEELRLILIDPKQVEFIVYDKLPHLMINEIITDANKVITVLNWAIKEMEHRYTLFQQKTMSGKLVREIDEYNASLSPEEEKLPKIVIIVDELADLMMVAKKDIEDRIQRLTQKSRAAGIHLVIATQRPSVDVITGIIKTNLPTRIAFRVSQEVDSRTILDCSGAEKLLGNGDLLYKTATMGAAARVQGAFLSSEEVQRVVEFIKANNEAYYDESVVEYLNSSERQQGGEDSAAMNMDGALDPVFIEALKYVVTIGQASISMLQRRCAVGYARAGKIIEWMESMGYISPFDGSKARKVLITKEEFEEKYGSIED